MANRQRAEARRKAAAKAARSEAGGAGGGSKGVMWTIIAALVVVAIGGIVWATRSGGSGSAATDSTTASSGTTSALPDSQPITITGDPLPTFDSGGGKDPAVGKAAPVVDGLNFNGEKMSLNSADGAYMVVFLAHWCPHCNAEVPRLLQWKHSGQVPADLRVIGVATAVSDTRPNYPPAQWFSNKGWEWPVMVDEKIGDAAAGKAATAFGASGWPYFIIVGKDGKVKVRVSGEISVADLNDVVTKAMAA